MRIRVTLCGVVSEGELFENQAPRTAHALWERLPIRDRTIQARWSGDAWRTQHNYELLDKEAPVENPAGRYPSPTSANSTPTSTPLSSAVNGSSSTDHST